MPATVSEALYIVQHRQDYPLAVFRQALTVLHAASVRVGVDFGEE